MRELGDRAAPSALPAQAEWIRKFVRPKIREHQLAARGRGVRGAGD